MLTFLLLLPIPAPPPQEPPPPSLEYDGGIRMANQAGTQRWRINGRVMFDALGAEGLSTVDDREIRRARLLAQGLLGDHLATRLQWDLSGSRTELLEGMLDWRDPSLGVLRLGHFREPFGLEARTSSGHLPFLERSAPSDAFTPGRNRGAMLWRRGERWSLAAGLFQAADAPLPADGLGEGRSVTLRATWLPLREADDARLAHLGLSLSYRRPRGGGVRLAAAPGIHLADDLIDTGTLSARSMLLLGLEHAWVDGPRSLRGELFLSDVELDGPDGRPWGLSLQGGWFLTGEHRAYRDSTSSLGAPKILAAVPDGGPGAWELALRWSRTDLDEGAIRAGTLEDLAVGLNWYLSSHARWMFEVVEARLAGPASAGRGVMLRLHLGF